MNKGQVENAASRRLAWRTATARHSGETPEKTLAKAKCLC